MSGRLNDTRFAPDGLTGSQSKCSASNIRSHLERAEVEWEKKVKRQSKTLDEAVVEYEHLSTTEPLRKDSMIGSDLPLIRSTPGNLTILQVVLLRT